MNTTKLLRPVRIATVLAAAATLELVLTIMVWPDSVGSIPEPLLYVPLLLVVAGIVFLALATPDPATGKRPKGAMAAVVFALLVGAAIWFALHAAN